MRITASLFIAAVFYFFNCQTAAAQAVTTYPDRIYGDTLHAPFYHGVGSTDPATDRVLIWTRYTPAAGQTTAQQVSWEMASDASFTTIVNSGTASTDASKDWTVTVDVTGLAADTYYWYRFKLSGGATSATGRTLTMPPAGWMGHLRFGVGSCSSIYSGYFNSYARVAERDDIRFFIHLGDYIYDFVDPDEEVRVPVPYPAKPTDLATYRQRHAYYMLDPDLRAARQQHPFICIYDNHDVSSAGVNTYAQAAQAFREWVPMRLKNAAEPGVIYRRLQAGNMLDIILMDVLTYKDDRTQVPAPQRTMTGQTEYNWLTGELAASTTKWRVLGSQNLFAGWYNTGSSTGVFDETSWDGYRVERNKLLGHLRQHNIKNTIVLSGDAHITQVMDLIEDPKDNSSYDTLTGHRATGMEFLASSISRGNVDEATGSVDLAHMLEKASLEMNPHHVFSDFVNHGYGLMDLSPDSAVAELWYSPILERTSTTWLGSAWLAKSDSNHWERTPLVAPNVLGVEDVLPAWSAQLTVYPNPTNGSINVVLNQPGDQIQSISTWQAPLAKRVLHLPADAITGNKATADLKGLPPGIYLLQVTGLKGAYTARVLLR